MDQLEMFEALKEGCAFCKILRGDVAARIVYEDEVAVGFLDHRPLLPGHCLLIPRVHVATLADLPVALIGPFFTSAQTLTRAVEKAMSAEGSFVAINNRISQSVPHLHVHIVPRRKKDGLFTTGFVWKRQPYNSAEDADAVQNAIKSALDEELSHSKG